MKQICHLMAETDELYVAHTDYYLQFWLTNTATVHTFPPAK